MAEVKTVIKIETSKGLRMVKSLISYDRYIAAKQEGQDLVEMMTAALVKEINEKYPDNNSTSEQE